MRKIDREKYPHLYEKHLNYGRSTEGRTTNKLCVKKYIASDKGKKTRKDYQMSEVGQEVHKKASRKYKATFNGAMQQRFWNKGLSEAERAAAINAFKNFNGRCYACGSTSPGSKKGWHLDHKGDKFRGILCHGCNIAAAMLKDSPLRCELLRLYLEVPRCCSSGIVMAARML